jgi:release factor glutamine methyltransferase
VNETWTIKRLIDWTTEYFKKFGIEWPHLEAEILLSHTLKVPRIQLYVQFERILKDDELAEFKKMILRRSSREPLAYITGHQPFMSLDFDINSSVLVPRQETEKLVEVAMERAKQLKSPIIADICCGSGVIAISLAKYVPQAAVHGTDISKEAAELSKVNAKKHGVNDRCVFYQGDLFEPLKELRGKLDLIVSNPPYIPSNDINGLQPEVSRFEPRAALDGGEDGLDLYRKIAAKAPEFLKAEGCLMLEIGIGQAEPVKLMLEKFKKVRTFKDLSGIERVIMAEV